MWKFHYLRLPQERIYPTVTNRCLLKKVNSLFSVHNSLGLGIKLLKHFRLQLLSHLNGHKFRNGFGDTISSLRACNAEIESTGHFLLRCQFYFSKRLELFDNLNKINPSFVQLSAKDQVNILLYGYSSITQFFLVNALLR